MVSSLQKSSQICVDIQVGLGVKEGIFEYNRKGDRNASVTAAAYNYYRVCWFLFQDVCIIKVDWPEKISNLVVIPADKNFFLKRFSCNFRSFSTHFVFLY